MKWPCELDFWRLAHHNWQKEHSEWKILYQEWHKEHNEWQQWHSKKEAHNKQSLKQKKLYEIYHNDKLLYEKKMEF